MTDFLGDVTCATVDGVRAILQLSFPSKTDSNVVGSDNGGTAPLARLRAAYQVQAAHALAFTTVVCHMTAQGTGDPATAQSTRAAVAAASADPEADPVAVAEGSGFLSLQALMTAARNRVHKTYVQSRGTGTDGRALQLRLTTEYAFHLVDVVKDPSLRCQMVLYNSSLKQLLDLFPATRDYYFLIGHPDQVCAQDASAT